MEDAGSRPAQGTLGQAVTLPLEQEVGSLELPSARELARNITELVVIGATYFVLARIGSALASVASIDPSAMPIWPATGFALAAVLLRGVRVCPAIFAAAFAANSTTDLANLAVASSIQTSLGIAAGNTLAAVVGGYLVNIWSNGSRTFDTPTGIVKFALITIGASTTISASVGVGSFYLAEQIEPANFATVWATWWLRDIASSLVIAPVITLWAISDLRALKPGTIRSASLAFVAATLVGLIAFSPVFEWPRNWSTLSFLAALPLSWAALRCEQRDAATTAFILSCFAVWGALMGLGPFALKPANAGVLPLVAFTTLASILSLIVSADVTARKQLAAQLHLHEQNLRAMFRQAAVGIAQADTTGRFTVINDRFCEIMQRPATQLLQMQIQDLIDPDDRPRVSNLLAHAINTGDAFAAEARHVLPDRSLLWVRSHVSALLDQEGAMPHLIVVAEDITPRRQAEENLLSAHADLQKALDESRGGLRMTKEALRIETEHRKSVEAALKEDFAERRKSQEALIESELRYRMVIQGVTDYAIFMLDQDGHVIHWNIGAQRIYQYTATEIVGEHFSRFYTEEERQRGEPARALRVAGYEGKHVVEGQRVRRDGSTFWASDVIEAVRNDVGTLVGYVNITRDIHERRAAQASLERAQEQLAQSQKMEALGQLTGSIAHDFNNLLMIISGHAQLLSRRLNDPKHLQAIEAVHSAATRGESLTRQLLAFSRRQPLNPVLADLNQCITAVHEMLVGSLRGNVRLKCDISSGVWPVEIDIAELELALVNIAVNARDAMPGGGIITLSARNVTLKQSDRVDQLEGDFVAVAMTDTGVGIAADVLPKIFEPFFTTKGLGKGTGLGLAQVYGFARQSQGAVIATSAVGSGTTITIYLPRRHAALATAPDTPPTQPMVPGEGTILVVEDNAEVADVTTSLVEQLGYRSLRAENASDALNRLQRDGKVDLVLTDIVMPGGMNGIALAQEIGRRYPHIPVLLTSGYSDVAQTAESKFPILRKPFQLPALEKSIREALETRPEQDGGDRVLQFSRLRGATR
jgi:PAS domain S-box-containing protein